MAQLGLCSRREADDWIAQGWVRVNGQVAQIGLQVADDDRIEVDRRARGRQAAQVTILLTSRSLCQRPGGDGHQPRHHADRSAKPLAGDPPRCALQPGHRKGLRRPCAWIRFGGAAVMTQDGRIARQLIATIDDEEGVPGAGQSHGRRRRPVPLPGGAARQAASWADARRNGAAAGRVQWQNPEQLRFVLSEGKKRQLRRMCELVGLKVVGLKRIRIGNVMLGNLPLGQWRYLGEGEQFQ